MEFEVIDSGQEAEIIAAAAATQRKKKGPDFSIRTVTHWMTLQHRMGFCTVPSHYENVPDSDFTGEKYDKYPNRMCVEIDGYNVCRWCFIASADVTAKTKGIPPTLRTEEDAAS